MLPKLFSRLGVVANNRFVFATLLLVATVFFSGAQLICLGILGEYVGRIYRAGKQRPLYLVRERLGNPPGSLNVVDPSRQEAA